VECISFIKRKEPQTILQSQPQRDTSISSTFIIDRVLILSLSLSLLQGCIKELRIDDKVYGLPEVDVTSNVTTGCGCTNATTCSSSSSLNASSSPRGNGSLEVITISRDLIRIVTQTDVGELEIMRVTPVQVAEGDSTIISPRHLAVTLDLSKFGIRESGVMFRINKAPQQGRIEVTTRTAGSSSQGRSTESFSLLDVGAGRVRYWHNGAEGTKDYIELSLRLVETSGFLLPAYLQVNTFLLPSHKYPRELKRGKKRLWFGNQLVPSERRETIESNCGLEENLFG
jgi:hypothetical protein